MILLTAGKATITGGKPRASGDDPMLRDPGFTGVP